MQMFEQFEMRKGDDVVLVNREQMATYQAMGYVLASEAPVIAAADEQPPQPPPPPDVDEEDVAAEQAPAAPKRLRRKAKDETTGEEAPGA